MKKSIREFNNMKKTGGKVTWITSYDAQTARIAERVGVDMILVGDSVGNNLLGYDNTLPVTMEEMIIFSKAVRRGAPNTFIVGDLPLGSYQISNDEAVRNSIRFIKEAHMDSVKCEGGKRMYDRVKAISDAGIGVVGHIGYTPQSTDLEGVVQSKSLDKFKILLEDAMALQDAGAWAILLEAVPNEPAGHIARKLKIPIYGIGAGNQVDGILAIVNDVVGLGTFKSRFVKSYCNAEEIMQEGIKKYIEEIKQEKFPSEEHFYPIKLEEMQKIKEFMEKVK